MQFSKWIRWIKEIRIKRKPLQFVVLTRSLNGTNAATQLATTVHQCLCVRIRRPAESDQIISVVLAQNTFSWVWPCCFPTFKQASNAVIFWFQARIQDFGQGASGVLTQRGGGPEPLLKIGIFPLKLPENCMILNKSGGRKEGPLDPLLGSWHRRYRTVAGVTGAFRISSFTANRAFFLCQQASDWQNFGDSSQKLEKDGSTADFALH